MMAQKNLHELLREDQEPFHLKDYIDDRRSQLKRPQPKTQLQVKKRKSIHESSKFLSSLCHQGCLFSLHDTPDLRKSPLFEFTSPAKIPCKHANAIFLNVPARTAAPLVEAALRIQKQSCPRKVKSQNKNYGLGLFGSLLKRLTPKTRTQKKGHMKGVEVKVSVEDILRWDSSVRGGKLSNERNIADEKVIFALEDKGASELSRSCSCSGRRPSSAVWSESNEEKPLNMETSTSSSGYDASEEMDFVSKQRQDTECASFDMGLCDSPFRFALQCSPSPGSRKPELRSPAVSPIRHKTEDKDDIGVESCKNFQTDAEVEEEEKEQFSPVSVLEPPFDDDDDGRENDEDDPETDMECSYAMVQRAKKQLLHKLRRFEKLAQLDPVELERRILDDQEQDDDETIFEDGEEGSVDDDTKTPEEKLGFKGIYSGLLCSPSFQSLQGMPTHIKRLASDLISEEEKEVEVLSDKETLIERAWKELELWKEKESDTINRMVEQDFCINADSWRKNVEHKSEVASDLELSIFNILVDELSEELV